MTKHTIEIPHTKTKNGNFYFRISIPPELRKYYDNKTQITYNLKTKDVAKAAKLAPALTTKYKAEFESLRTTGSGVREEAHRLLKEHNLQPVPLAYQPQARHITPEVAEIGFNDSAYEIFRQRVEEDYGGLSDPVVDHAFAILKGTNPITLSDAYKLALQGEKERKRIDDINRAFKYVSALVTVDDVSQINPIALQRHIDTQQQLAPDTVRRYINKVAEYVDEISKQYGKLISNPLRNITYRKRKSEPQKRATLTPEQFTLLQQLIKSKWEVNSAKLTAILLNTGLRVAEAAGVETKHVVLDAPVPYLIITKTEQRRLKNTNSERRVPLFGVSLEAVKTLLSQNGNGRFIFPNYNKNNRTSNDSASAAANKWLKDNGLTDITTHSFRHTLNTRMAEAGIFKEVRELWHGWASQDMASHYGNVQALTLLQNAITQLNEYEQSKNSRYKTI